MSGSPAQKVMIAYEVPEADASWELEEENVPESAWHDAVIELLKLILRAWAERAALDSLIASHLALRWNPKLWKVGVDPDVAVYLPAPPEGEDTASVCTWDPGHHPPRVAVEVVSRSTAKLPRNAARSMRARMPMGRAPVSEARRRRRNPARSW
jgi:Uma2 family endonuclease